MGSSPGGEIKILHATQQVQKKKKKKSISQYVNLL